jgi:hypothetical protein
MPINLRRNLSRLLSSVTGRSRHKAARLRHSRQACRSFETLEQRVVLTAGMLDPTFGLGGAAFLDFPGSNHDFAT